MTHSLDPSQIRDDAWELIELTPYYRRYICWISREEGTYALKTEFLANDKLIADNQQELHDSQGKRFGDGQVVARIPLNVLYSQQSQIMDKMREGDEDHLRWFLNSEKARPFRTFRGVI